MGVYLSPAELRAEPEVPDADPPSDATLEQTIDAAEDRIDGWLGGWPIRDTGPSAGRKIVETEIMVWQWQKLKRATARLAARLHENPNLLAPARYDRVKGPDFEKQGPSSPTAQLADVALPLNASGLRRLGGRATA